MLRISESSNFLNASDSLSSTNKVEQLLSYICQHSPFKKGDYRIGLSISPHFTLLTGTLMPPLSKANFIERWLFEEILPIAEGFSEKENAKAKRLINVDSLVEKIGIENTFVLLCRGCQLSYGLTKYGNAKEKQHSQNAFHLFSEELKAFIQQYKNIPALTDELRFSRNPSVDAFIHALEQKQSSRRNLWIGAALAALASIAAAFKYATTPSSQTNLTADNQLVQRVQSLPFHLTDELPQELPQLSNPELLNGLNQEVMPETPPLVPLLVGSSVLMGVAATIYFIAKRRTSFKEKPLSETSGPKVRDCSLSPAPHLIPSNGNKISILKNLAPMSQALFPEDKNTSITQPENSSSLWPDKQVTALADQSQIEMPSIKEKTNKDKLVHEESPPPPPLPLSPMEWEAVHKLTKMGVQKTWKTQDFPTLCSHFEKIDPAQRLLFIEEVTSVYQSLSQDFSTIFEKNHLDTCISLIETLKKFEPNERKVVTDLAKPFLTDCTRIQQCCQFLELIQAIEPNQRKHTLACMKAIFNDKSHLFEEYCVLLQELKNIPTEEERNKLVKDIQLLDIARWSVEIEPWNLLFSTLKNIPPTMKRDVLIKDLISCTTTHRMIKTCCQYLKILQTVADDDTRKEIINSIPEKFKGWFTEIFPILATFTPKQRTFIRKNQSTLSQCCFADFRTLLKCLQGLSLEETEELYRHLSGFHYWSNHDTLETKPPQERLEIVRLINSLCSNIGWDNLTSPDDRVSRFSLLKVISKIPHPQREAFMGFITRTPHPNLVKDLRELHSIFNSLYYDPIDESIAAEIIELAQSYGLGNPAQSLTECNKIFQCCLDKTRFCEEWKVKNREEIEENQLEEVIKQAKALKIIHAFKKESWFEFLDVLAGLSKEKMTRLDEMNLASKEGYDLSHAFGFLCNQGVFGVASEGVSDIIIEINRENKLDSFCSLIRTLMEIDPTQRKVVADLAKPFLKSWPTYWCNFLKSIYTIAPQQREHVVTCTKEILGEQKYYNGKECILLLDQLNNIPSEKERANIAKQIQKLKIPNNTEDRPWDLLFSALKNILPMKRDVLINDLISLNTYCSIENCCENLELLQTVSDDDTRKEILSCLPEKIKPRCVHTFPILASFTSEQRTFIKDNISKCCASDFISLIKCLQGLSIEEMKELYSYIISDLRAASRLVSSPPQERLEIMRQVASLMTIEIFQGVNNISSSNDVALGRLNFLEILPKLSRESRQSLIAYIPQLKESKDFNDLMNFIRRLLRYEPSTLEEIICLSTHYRHEGTLTISDCAVIFECSADIIETSDEWKKDKNKDDESRLNKAIEQAQALKIVYPIDNYNKYNWKKSWKGLLKFIFSLSPEKADFFVKEFNSRFENGCDISIFNQLEQFEEDQRDTALAIVIAFLYADLPDLLKLLKMMINIDSKDRIKVLTDAFKFLDPSDSIFEFIHFLSLFINQSLRQYAIQLAEMEEVKQQNSSIKQFIAFFESTVAAITWKGYDPFLRNKIDESEREQIFKECSLLPLYASLGDSKSEENIENYHQLFDVWITIPKEQRAGLIKQLNEAFKDGYALDLIPMLIEMLCSIDEEHIRNEILQSLKSLLKQNTFGVSGSRNLSHLINKIVFIGLKDNFTTIKPLLELVQKGNFICDFTKKTSVFDFSLICKKLSKIPETERETLIEDINHFVGPHPISLKEYYPLFDTIHKIGKNRKELLALVLSLSTSRNYAKDRKILKVLKEVEDLEERKEFIENIKFFFPPEMADQARDCGVLSWTIEILKLFSYEERKGECKTLLQNIFRHSAKKLSSGIKDIVEMTAPQHRVTILKLIKNSDFYTNPTNPNPIDVLITLFRENHEISMDSADYLKVYFDQTIHQAIEKGKVTKTLCNLTNNLQKFKKANNEALHRLGEHATNIYLAFKNTKKTNPIQIFQALKRERQDKEQEIIEKFSISPSQTICGKSIFLNLNTFRERGCAKKITFGDLPENIGFQTLSQLFLEFENRFKCEQEQSETKREDVVKVIQEIKTLTEGSDFIQLKEALHRSEVLRLLNLRGKPDQPIEAVAYYLHMIIKAISEANNEHSSSSLSQRERMLIGFASYIKNCSPRQRKQMKDYYDELPLEYRLKTGKTISSIQEKIECFTDLAIQSCLNEMLSSRKFLIDVTKNPNWDGDVYQLILYLQNRLFWLLGLDHKLIPDVYTGILPNEAVEADLQTLMKKVLSHLTPKKVIRHLNQLLQKAFKEKDKLIKDLKSLKENNTKIRNQINLDLQELKFEAKLEILKTKELTIKEEIQKSQQKIINNSTQILAISNSRENSTAGQIKEIQKIKKAEHLRIQQENLIKNETQDQKMTRHSQIEALEKSLETLNIKEAEWENSKGQGLLSATEVGEYLTKEGMTNTQSYFDFDEEMNEIKISDEGTLSLLLSVGYLQET